VNNFFSLKSLVLVILQLISVIYIFITGKFLPDNIILLIISILSLLVMIYSFIVMKFYFNIAPELLPGANFVSKGPYKFIRHPMYSSGALYLICLIINEFSLLRLISLIVLIAVFLTKISMEEKILEKNFTGYKSYKAGTRKLIPFIY
jgi:protein-S-isoprenylcysteine O-methyltransferase Ste14